MGLRLHLLASCAIAALSMSSASAALLQAQWVEIANNYPYDAVPNYSAAVVANDSTLGSTPARTFDLVATATSGALWTSCDLQINASPQSMYVKAGSSMTRPVANTWAAQPAAAFSTFICVPTLQNVTGVVGEIDTGARLLGMAQYPVESGMGTAVLNTTKIDAAWGDIFAMTKPNSGSFTIARITLLNSFTGGVTFAGRIGATNNNPAPAEFAFTTQEIPEPLSASALLAGAALLIRRPSRG